MLELATGCCILRGLEFWFDSGRSGYLRNWRLLDLGWSSLFRCLFRRWVQVILQRLWCQQELLLLQLLLLLLRWVNDLVLLSVFGEGMIVALSERLLFLPVYSWLSLTLVIIFMLLIDLHASFNVVIRALMNERAYWLWGLCSRPRNRRSIGKINIGLPLTFRPQGMTEQPFSLIIICFRASRVICLDLEFLEVIRGWLTHGNTLIARKVALLVTILLQVAAVLICIWSLIHEVWLVSLAAELLAILYVITVLISIGLMSMIWGRVRSW